MKSLTFFLFLCVGQLAAQQHEWRSTYSDEFHFMANFPEEPRQSSGDIDLSVGKGSVRRWVSAFPGVTYAILVVDLSVPERTLEGRELESFYSQVCIDLGGGARSCGGPAGYNLFGVEGVMGGFRTAEGEVGFEMFLTGTRLYIAKVESKNGVEKGVADDRKKFLDDFLFVHVDQKEKKSIWGLPNVKETTPIAPDSNNIHEPPA